jgi:hypothetical protein
MRILPRLPVWFVLGGLVWVMTQAVRADEPPRWPAATGIGIYAGFPSVLGLEIVTPADGTLAFRAGLTAFPGVGVVWTPGLEYRFGQEPGTYSRDGGYGFTDLFFSRNYVGRDRNRSGLEAGLGYRWVLPDIQGFRWIAAAEAGGQWDHPSVLPDRPSLRAYWVLAGM